MLSKQITVMRRQFSMALSLSLCICVLAAASIAQNAPPMPKIEGDSISGHKVVLPDASHGKVAVLIFGFTKASKGPTSAWADKIDSDFRSRPGFELYQLPVLEDVPRFIRGMVISSMKKSIRENMRDHFVPVLQNETELKKLVNYKEADDAYLVLLNPIGQVVGQRHGGLDQAAYAELRSEIQSLLDHPK